MANTTQVKKQAETVTDRASVLAQDVQELGHAAKRAVTDGASAVRDSANAYLDEGRARARELGEQVQTHVSDQPLKSVMIAAGVGFLLGMFWVRR